MRERRGIGAFLAVLAALLSIGALLLPIALLLGFAVAATEPPPSFA